ncbi:MAG: hypothetical protein K2X93_21880 [Candidatus Obscuribacterales bacterium]|nr:hypothetical protein [Candidatus Obscuribacterales bacterium]
MNLRIKPILLSALVLPLTWQAAQAQHKTIDPYELPDASKIHRSRPKVEYVLTGPEVSVRLPRPEPKQKLIFKVPPNQVPEEEVYVIDGSKPGRSGSRPGTIEVDLSNPPPSGFTSNIPAGGMSKPKGLRPGTSTNMLGNKALSGWMGTQASSPGRLLNAVKKPSAAAPAPAPAVLTYKEPTATGTTGASRSVTKSDVSGKLLRRTLLDNK